MIATKYRKPRPIGKYVMSAHHTWFGRSITRSRNRDGKILWPTPGLLVRGFGPRHSIPISRGTRLRLTRTPSAASSATIRRDPKKGQRRNNASIRRIRARSSSFAARRSRIYARSRNPQHRALSPDRKPGSIPVELRSTIRGAHFPNLVAKKSFSIVSCPIFACSSSISRRAATSAS